MEHGPPKSTLGVERETFKLFKLGRTKINLQQDYLKLSGKPIKPAMLNN